MKSPRSKERGPIEGPRSSHRGQGIPGLRARKSAAPLKVHNLSYLFQGFQRSPRSKERGPIEGSAKPSLCYLRPGLRARKSAAPLKEGRTDRPGLPRRRLRARKSAAPLKVGAFGMLADGLGWSPRSKERGPIEGVIRSIRGTIGRTSPRSKERGPIEGSNPVSSITFRYCLRARKSAAPLKAPTPTTYT